MHSLVVTCTTNCPPWPVSFKVFSCKPNLSSRLNTPFIPWCLLNNLKNSQFTVVLACICNGKTENPKWK